MSDASVPWPSPITAQAVVAAADSPGSVLVVGEQVFWSESRPAEGGRIQLVRRRADGSTQDLLGEGVSARTRVHEYGGGAWTVVGPGDGSATVLWASWDDQRLWRLDLDAAGPSDRHGFGEPRPITPEPATRHGLRYADLDVHGDLVVCVRESHEGEAFEAHGEAVNEVVALPLDGSAAPVVLVTGPDFVAAPRIAPDGDRLAWIQWQHPSMPWDATELRVADLARGEAVPASVSDAVVVAGGPEESVIQPAWSPDGVLHLVSDRTDWWNLERWTPDGGRQPVTALEAEIGTPPWVFDMRRYGFLGDGTIAIAYASDGLDTLALVEPPAEDGTPGAVTDVETPFSEIASIATGVRSVTFVGAGFTQEAVVATVEVTTHGPEAPVVVRASRDLGLDDAWFSVARPVSFPSGPDGQRTAHALYYPPTNPGVGEPAGPPPLLVLIHGGPTAMARGRLDLAKQYWTSRGFALVDVNYGGSTGYGRAYRNLLQGSWGVVDVEDCIAAARHLADQGLADPARLAIRGGSAGGFTVLAALAGLTGEKAFAAGACSYGVADLTALAEETHKFESRYLDGLVGPYPEARDVYVERSPLTHVDRLDSPLIVFQGLEDEIVPPNQSEMIVEALQAKGVTVEYHAFEGEQHGFRKAETVVAVLEAELAFYEKVL